MILVDTSVWVNHLRRTVPELVLLLSKSLVTVHPFVVGELAMGSIARRDEVLREMGRQPAVRPALDREVMRFIETHRLFGLGIGYVDAHLLVAARLNPGTLLWTTDHRLHEIAERFSLSFDPRKSITGEER